MKAVMKDKFVGLMVIGFLFATLLLLTVFNAYKPRILVVHSLSKESSWSSAVDVGIARALANNRLPVSVSREYLNLDILSVEGDLSRVLQEIRHKISAIDPHVLLVVDDETSHLLGRHYVDHEDIKLVFAGLMQEPEHYGYSETKGVIGVREPAPLAPIVAVLDEVGAGAPMKIAVLGIDDITGQAEMKQVLNFDWGKHHLLAHALVPHFEDWKQFVSGPAQGADALVVLSIDKVPEKSQGLATVPESQVVGWTESNSKPLPIAVRDSFVQMGGGLAISVPPSELGELGLNMALARLAETKQSSELDTITTVAFDVSLRQSVLEKRKVELPEIYRQAARAAGRLYP